MRQHCNGRARAQQRSFAKACASMEANCFFNLLTSPELLGIVEAHLPEHRERKFPPTQTLAMFLGQVMSPDGSCQQAVNQAVVSRLLMGLSPGSSNTGGYCQARARLPVSMVRELAQQIGAALRDQTPSQWLWQGRRVFIVDGTTVSMPDSQSNRTRFRQHGNQTAGVGMPLSRLVVLMSLSNGALLDGALGTYQGKGMGELGLFRTLLDRFTSGDVLLGDSLFCSYFLIADLRRRGVDVVVEQHGARITDFRRGERLAARDHRVQWRKPARPAWLSTEEYAAYPEHITLREVQVNKKVLVTSLLVPRVTPKAALSELFSSRWDAELNLRNIKTTLGMEHFRCQTPAMCEKEMWVYLLAYNLIRLLMAQAAAQARLLPQQMSFKHTLTLWTTFSAQQLPTCAQENIAHLFILIAQRRVGNRPGRIEPRMRKRRPKPYPHLDRPRAQARAEILRYGHPKILPLN
jgi:hypothetical protein